MKKKKTIKILSLDGGGIMGIVSLRVLSQIMKDTGGKTIPELFNLVSGTSTGAIIAAGITAPREESPGVYSKDPAYPLFSAEEMYDIYLENMPYIFYQGPFKFLRTIKQLFGPKYPHKHPLSFLKEKLKDRKTSDALTDLLIPTLDTNRNEPVFVKKRPQADGDIEDPIFHTCDVAMSSSSAPTYFPPMKLMAVNGSDRIYSCIDGGVFANNPALFSFIEAMKIYGYDTDEIQYKILSLGTGDIPLSYPYNKVKHWGATQYVSPLKGMPLMQIFFAGQEKSSAHILQKIPGVEMTRINPVVEKEIQLDDARKKTINYLVDIADQFVLDNADFLKQTAESLLED